MLIECSSLISIEVEIRGVQDGEIRLKVTPEVEITSRLVSMNF
jgi:hypothetical protein